MAKLYVDKSEDASKIVWLYVMQTKAEIEIIPYDERDIEMSAINIFKTMPLLLDGETKVWGSQAVLYYIAEKYTNFKGLGKTPEERAKSESIISWASGTLKRTVTDLFVSVLLTHPEQLQMPSNKEILELGRNQTNQQLQTLEGHYFTSNFQFLLDKQPQFVDFIVFLTLASLDTVQFDLKPYPKIARWLSEMKKQTEIYNMKECLSVNGQ